MEKWKPVVGFEKLYEVSSAGRVRSLDRIVANRYSDASHRKGKVLSPVPDRAGYLQVGLSADNVVVMRKVHRLIATAFLKAPPHAKAHVNHINFKVADNRAANLEWCTPKQNSAHSVKAGRYTARVSPRRAKKLTLDAALKIRAAKAAGIPSKSIAAQFGITRRTIDRIVEGVIWVT